MRLVDLTLPLDHDWMPDEALPSAAAFVVAPQTHPDKGFLVGTETGIYTSFNDGANWQSLRLELPVTPVHGIVIKDDDLVIGTHGRAFWVLDGIHVLRQLQPEVTTASLHVFTPVPAQRRVQQTAAIDYYLEDAAEKVTIEFLDASGKLVRKFESEPPKKEEAKPGAKPAAGGGGGDEGEEEGPRGGPPPARRRAGRSAGSRRRCPRRTPRDPARPGSSRTPACPAAGAATSSAGVRRGRRLRTGRRRGRGPLPARRTRAGAAQRRRRSPRRRPASRC